MKREAYPTLRNIKSVTHPFFGRGEVLEQRLGGYELLVHFHIGITLWIPLSRLIPPEKQNVLPPVMEIPPMIGDYNRRELLEAFKLGIVPHKEVLNFTYGREKEIEKVKDALLRSEKNGGGCMLVEGEYGSGKTHFLDYIYLYALSEGFAVSKVELDPFDVTPYRPRRIYREIVLSFFSKYGGFREFVEKALRENILNDNRFFSFIEEPDEAIWDWIEGKARPRWWLSKRKKTRKLPLLPSFSTAADNYCYILSSIGWAYNKLKGRGLVILLDEAESLFHLWWKTLSIQKGINLLKGLALTSLNLLPEGIDGRVFRDKEIDATVEEIDGRQIIHRGIKNCMTPYIYKKPSNIFLVLAFTPTAEPSYENNIPGLLEDGVDFLSLGRLSKEDYQKMFDKLFEIYISSFPDVKISKIKIQKIKKVLIRLENRGVRTFLKATIDALDLVRHYPEIDIEILLQN